jgi:hypothetical protein
MTPRHSLESDSLDSLLSAARELVQQLERVKSAETHHERAPGRRRRRATQEQSVDKPHFTALFRAISAKALAYVAELEGQETHAEETHEDEEPHEEPHEQTHKEPHEQTLERHPRLSERNTRAANLRFLCRLSQLGKIWLAPSRKRDIN